MSQPPMRYPRGSEWRRWDLHVHTPASFYWRGQKFSATADQPQDIALIDQMILALNNAKADVFALMDYWTFDGWFALKRRLSQPNAPALTKKVFPGIELRLCAPIQGRLNAHAIFSDDIPDQHLRDFLSQLRLEITEQPLSPDALRTYAIRAGADKLKHHGFDKAKVDKDADYALLAGAKIAELKADTYKAALKSIPDGRALGFMPFKTNDGLDRVKWYEHYAYAISLFEASPIFEARDDATWNAFVGRKTDENAAWIDNFQAALRGVPRLPVSGSDAHQFVGVAGDNDKRGYGDFPSNRATWIKADPTWAGLLQAIREPQKRCHIGETPPKLRRVEENRTFYIDRVRVSKKQSSTLADEWFDGAPIELNRDLVAIIGNKGSGKSALADVIALLGNSQETSHFSFLRRDRFRGKAGDPARHFVGRLDWLAGDPCEQTLDVDPSTDRVELVRYIPQGRFEHLCNEHVSGKSEAFERELRDVIFSHIPDASRLGALSFDQLIEEQEKSFRAKLIEVRKRLGATNRTIASIEEQLNPDIRKNLEEQLRLKERQLAELTAAKPAEVTQPSAELTVEQRLASAQIEQANGEAAQLATRQKALTELLTKNAVKRRAANAALERIDLFQTQYAEFARELSEELERLELSLTEIVSFTVKDASIKSLLDGLAVSDSALKKEAQEVAAAIGEKQRQVAVSTAALNEPQRLYQAYRVVLAEWEQRIAEINGAADVPDSKAGLEARLRQLDELPERLRLAQEQRLKLCGELFDILSSQRDARAKLFAPLQSVIAGNDLIGPSYKLQFQANLASVPDVIAENLFSVVKQNVGALRGEEESRAAIKAQHDQRNMNKRDDVLQFVEAVHSLLHESARQIRKDGNDIKPILRKDRAASEAYDYLYSLEYLNPKYTLLFQDTPIEQLSPGQRGALLLIFYLLVDTGRNPIILDQPEENLDNETIVSLLVPVLNAAREMRQIIMVTHNPNLAVVCDAEQIILATFDRKNGAKISYVSGSIEDLTMNGHVVNVLEGTKPAFDNRSRKYH